MKFQNFVKYLSEPRQIEAFTKYQNTGVYKKSSAVVRYLRQENC